MQSGKARDAQLKRKKFEIELIKSKRSNKKWTINVLETIRKNVNKKIK